MEVCKEENKENLLFHSIFTKKTPVLSLLNGLVKWSLNRLNNVTPFTQLGNERTVMGLQLPMVLGIRNTKRKTPLLPV